jgi:phage-related minor tail protein
VNEEQLRVVIRAELDQFRRDINSAQQEVRDFSNESSGNVNKFSKVLGTVSAASTKALKTIAVGLAGVATGLVALSQQGKEFSQSQAQIKTAFEANGASAEAAKKTYNELYRVLGDNGKATEAALHLGKLTNSEKELAEWTKISTGIYATFGDSLPIESLTEAVNHSSKLGEVQGTLADALEWSGISVDEFNDQLFWCNTESEREKLIRDTLNGLYSESAEEYEKNNKAVLEQNEAQLSLNDTLARLYEVLSPVLAMLMQILADVLEPLMPKLKEFIENHGPAIEDTLGKIAEVIGKVIGWIVDNWELVLSIAGVIAGITAAISILTGVITVVNTVMAASPVTWIILGIVAAIAAIIAIIIVCIKYWDEIKAVAIKCWEGIKNVWNTVASWFNNTIIQPIAKFFSGMWNGLKDGAKSAWEGIKSVFSAVGNFFSDIFSKAWKKVKDVFSTGGEIFTNIKDGIITAFKVVVNAIIRGINAVVGAPFKGLNGILDKISGISIAGVKPFSWLTWRATIPEIPQLATGGITNGATLAMIGERGKEAVLPLENNTEWMDLLAQRIVALTGDGTPIYLTVDGKVFAQTVLKTVNANTKQTGKLGLVLA